MKKVIIESMLLEAKTSKNDFMAECWILTAKTLGTCFEIEFRNSRVTLDPADTYPGTISGPEPGPKFFRVSDPGTVVPDYSSESKFWDQVSKIIDAVKIDRSDDEMVQFYKNVFEKLLPAMQQTLLLEMAEKQKDKMEQCRYLLLLFKLFPESAGQFG
uniref:Integrator complex subunit 10 n=1 Tax=Romanomermis culicivorax TaxID=13658 RepID=A0A915JC23_ROMCU